MTCDGIYVWYPCTGGGVLECSRCGDITVTGNWNNEAHSQTPVLMEGV